MKDLNLFFKNLADEIEGKDSLVVIRPKQLEKLNDLISFNELDCSFFPVPEHFLNLKALKFFVENFEEEGYYCLFSSTDFRFDIFSELKGFSMKKQKVTFVINGVFEEVDFVFIED